MNNLLLFSVNSARSRAAVWVSSTLTSLTICKAVVQHQNHWISAHFLTGFLYKEQIIFFLLIIPSSWYQSEGGRFRRRVMASIKISFCWVKKQWTLVQLFIFWEDLTRVNRSCLWWFLYNFYLSHWRATEENTYKKRKETIKNIDDVKYSTI